MDRETGAMMREESQERRARNRDYATERLIKMGIDFESKNDGAHLILAIGVDYWPGTGYWKFRINKRRGRGLQPLLRAIGQTIYGDNQL